MLLSLKKVEISKCRHGEETNRSKIQVGSRHQLKNREKCMTEKEIKEKVAIKLWKTTSQLHRGGVTPPPPFAPPATYLIRVQRFPNSGVFLFYLFH